MKQLACDASFQHGGHGASDCIGIPVLRRCNVAHMRKGVTSYLHLQRAYANRPMHLGAIIDEDTEHLCVSVDAFLGVAYDLGVLGLEKVGDAARIAKLRDRLAEVHFAICAARWGARVELLADEAFGVPPLYTPDLRIELPGLLTVLVEVTRFSDSLVDLVGGVRAALRKARLPHNVDCRIGQEFSQRKAGHKFRRRGEEFVDHVSKRVASELCARPETASGTFYVSRQLDELSVEFVEGSVNEAERSWRLLSSVAAVSVDRDGISAQATHMAPVDVEGFADSLEFKLRQKIAKRAQLPAWAHDQPFVVAIRCDGSQPSPDVVTAVLDAAYMENAWTSALDGVLASHSSIRRGDANLQWLPNPSRRGAFD